MLKVVLTYSIYSIWFDVKMNENKFHFAIDLLDK